MNYIRHLTSFFHRVSTDPRPNPSHISLYMALFQLWNTARFQNPLSVARSELMRISKIAAKATYHKCLRELHQWGYIGYQPSNNPLKGSTVIMFAWDETTSSKSSPLLVGFESVNGTLPTPLINPPNRTPNEIKTGTKNRVGESTLPEQQNNTYGNKQSRHAYPRRTGSSTGSPKNYAEPL